MNIAIASGAITPDDLLADFLIATPEATLTIAADAPLLGAIVWRLGRGAYRKLITDGIDVADVADVILSRDEAEQWIGRRSRLALDAGAMLIAHRGGDALERAEFARLFAIGEPQEGLDAFLTKRRARFR